MKNNITSSQVDLFIQKLGGKEIWDDVLDGKKEVVVKEPEFLLFDDYGRRIPLENLSASVCDSESEFFFDKIIPKDDDFAERLKIFHYYKSDEITLQEFKTETKRLIALISENPWSANILKGPWLPVIVPRIKTCNAFGQLVLRYLERAGESYWLFFKNRKFFISKELQAMSDKIGIDQTSRQNRLVLRTLGRSVIGIYFPSALQGFSIPASREQMLFLPERFVLSGIDTIFAMIMYPDILAKNFNVPGINLPGLTWPSNKTLYFRVYDDEFSVVLMPSLEKSADGGTTSGLFFF